MFLNNLEKMRGILLSVFCKKHKSHFSEQNEGKNPYHDQGQCITREINRIIKYIVCSQQK